MTFRTASLLSLSITFFAFVIAPAALVYAVDPFQIYHASFFKNAGYSSEQQYQHAGWINRLLADPEKKYESIVIGSSTVANYTQILINQYLPWGNTLNLSVNGSHPIAQATIARHALATNPGIKHILWDVHNFYAFDADYHGDPNVPDPFPYYLYNQKISDDKPYIFNVTNIETSIKFLLGDFTKFTGDVENNGPFNKITLAAGLYDAYATDERKRTVLFPMIAELERHLPDKAEYSAYQYASLDRNLLDILLPFCNSDKDIKIIFSPKNRLFYAEMANLDFLNQQLFMRRHLVEKTQHCNNIMVFAFDNIDWVTANLNNYADMQHHRIEINEFILASIAKNENVLTAKNIQDYEIAFMARIVNFKEDFNKYIDTRKPISETP